MNTIAAQMLHTTADEIIDGAEADELFLAAIDGQDASKVVHVGSMRCANGMTITQTAGAYDDGQNCTGFHVRDADGEFVDFFSAGVRVIISDGMGMQAVQDASSSAAVVDGTISLREQAISCLTDALLWDRPDESTAALTAAARIAVDAELKVMSPGLDGVRPTITRLTGAETYAVASRTDGAPHLVVVHEGAASCSCQSTGPCWAVREVMAGRESNSTNLLEQLDGLGREKRHLAILERDLVERARTAAPTPISWHRIALALGRTTEGVRRKYRAQP